MFEPMISVVIPVYNRTENLKLTLTALDAQHLAEPIEVVVCDDGSDDRPLEVLQSGPWKFEWAFTSHPRAGVQIARTRNEGARMARGKNYYFIDSDVLLNPWALDNARKYALELPETIFCGRYDWLPPMEIQPSQIGDHFEDFAAGNLTRKDIDYVQDIIGPDPKMRTDPELWDCTKKIAVFGGSTLSGNLIVPYYWFMETHGFDENIVGQGQDAEFGHHLQALGAGVVFCPHIIGYHVAHPIDRAWKTKSVRDTIRYIYKKYNLPLNEEDLPV